VPRPQQEMHEGRQDVAMAHAGNGRDDAPRAAAQPASSRAAVAEIDPNDPATWGKVSRNSACPCGSGKKFKHCHGKLS